MGRGRPERLGRRPEETRRGQRADKKVLRRGRKKVQRIGEPKANTAGGAHGEERGHRQNGVRHTELRTRHGTNW